jgi:hypothetical protein
MDTRDESEPESPKPDVAQKRSTDGEPDERPEPAPPPQESTTPPHGDPLER